MTDFQPKNLNELESYLEKLALREGPVCFALFKSIQRIGHLSSPDVLEYVRIAQNKMAEQKEPNRTNFYTVKAGEWVPTALADLGYFPDGAPVQPSDVGVTSERVGDYLIVPSVDREVWTAVDRSGEVAWSADRDNVVKWAQDHSKPLTEGDDERTLPGDPLPIAGNPLSGAENLEMTPAQQRAARARAARQANLAARRQ